MKSKQVVAAEILTTGWCPLDCKYCYIPKTEHMKDMHKEIVQSIEDGSLVENLYNTVGDGLEYLGFWGTEPTLTLPLIGNHMKAILDRFPKLKEINFSTNGMMDPMITVNYALSLIDVDRPLELKIQFSLDGPAWITDNNRKGGAADMIVDNLLSIVKELNDVDLGNLKLEFRWKPTHSIQNFRDFVDRPYLMSGYKAFFDDINTRFTETNTNKSVTHKGFYSSTIVVPGKYTSADGKVFAEYVKLTHKCGLDTSYTSRLMRLVKYTNDLSKRRQFSCSGGDSNIGLDTEVHICHRTFYYNNPKYVKSVMENVDVENWDVSLFEQGMLDHINKWFIVDSKNEMEYTRFLYVMRGYHDFWKHQIGYINAMMMELAMAGQVDPIYATNDKLRGLFALFQNACMSCPMENLLNTGSIHLQVVSLLRLFGNGAFQEIVRRTEERLKDD